MSPPTASVPTSAGPATSSNVRFPPAAVAPATSDAAWIWASPPAAMAAVTAPALFTSRRPPLASAGAVTAPPPASIVVSPPCPTLPADWIPTEFTVVPLAPRMPPWVVVTWPPAVTSTVSPAMEPAVTSPAAETTVAPPAVTLPAAMAPSVAVIVALPLAVTSPAVMVPSVIVTSRFALFPAAESPAAVTPVSGARAAAVPSSPTAAAFTVAPLNVRSPLAVTTRSPPVTEMPMFPTSAGTPESVAPPAVATSARSRTLAPRFEARTSARPLPCRPTPTASTTVPSDISTFPASALNTAFPVAVTLAPSCTVPAPAWT